MLSRTVLLQLANNKALEAFVRKNPWSTRVAGRFVAGETLDDAARAVKALNTAGMTASLDHLGESVTNEQEVAATVDTYLRMLKFICDEALNANVSLKLTALGLDIADDLAQRNLARILDAAGPNQFIRIDMEGSAYTQRTLDLFYRLWDGAGQYRNVGVVIQAYLYRSEADVTHLIEAGARVRLCKGAYKEDASVAYPDKADVDRNYIRLMEPLLSRGNYPAIATHDERMIEAALRYVKAHAIPPERYEFQMLYGIRRDLQMKLVRDGHGMRVYTPFGTQWYPYFMRRLAERPANLWFVLKNALHR